MSIEFEVLVDWVDGRLPADRAAAVAAEIAQGDPRTRAIVAWLHGFVATGQRLPLEEPPPIVRQRLRAHFQQWASTERGLAQEMRRFSASVLFDSRHRAGAAGVRGAVVDDVVHLAYTTDAADVVLDVQRLADHRVRIDGQVLLGEGFGGAGTADGVFEAVVFGPGFEIRGSDSDSLGRFQVAAVPDDAQQLQVSNGRLTVTADLDLRPNRS